MKQKIIKNICLGLILLTSSIACASPWSSLSSSMKAWFSRLSYNHNQAQSQEVSAQATTTTAVTATQRNNPINYLIGCGLGLSALAGYYTYRAWDYNRAGRTKNIAEAIIQNNDKGIQYWLPKVKESNINKHLWVTEEDDFNKKIKVSFWTTPFLVALRNQRNDLLPTLCKYKPNLDALNELYGPVSGQSLQANLDKDPTLLKTLLDLGLDPNRHYDWLNLPENASRTTIYSDIPLLFPFVMRKDKKAVLTLVRHGAELHPDLAYKIRKYSCRPDQELFLKDFFIAIDTPLIHEEASRLVNKTRMATLASKTAVLPEELREKIESFL